MNSLLIFKVAMKTMLFGLLLVCAAIALDGAKSSSKSDASTVRATDRFLSRG